MINLTKIEQQAPGLVSLAKTAAVSLQKTGLTDQRAAVQLVLDHSGSMERFYRSGDVQHLAEQALGLSTNLDDDGAVPLIYFGSYADQHEDIRLENYAGIIQRTHPQVHWGSTDYVAAMKAAIAEHQNAFTTEPGLIIFQTDGEPDDRWAAERLLKKASKLPIFWAFIGFGDRVSFLEKLDDLRGRKVDNAAFFHAANPHTVTDEQLYDGITSQFAQWLTAARAAGILT
ncbi:VWA domain-containing protein [Streptomyces sp. MBT97]|uniref:VWA domain-containing protein n=1 Tax=Streptomyces sp. MBT97 TaxID=2800411 RepID=UPI00190D1BA1|nr:VWA domain-containing protein [Streptomyces sp. MBT97]MBK3631598.1 VWA domain-containing protein [Streptomyces sp. MBT97]